MLSPLCSSARIRLAGRDSLRVMTPGESRRTRWIHRQACRTRRCRSGRSIRVGHACIGQEFRPATRIAPSTSVSPGTGAPSAAQTVSTKITRAVRSDGALAAPHTHVHARRVTDEDGYQPRSPPLARCLVRERIPVLPRRDRTNRRRHDKRGAQTSAPPGDPSGALVATAKRSLMVESVARVCDRSVYRRLAIAERARRMDACQKCY